MSDLPSIIDKLTELHFPESTSFAREQFSNDLCQKIGKLRREQRTRNFSVGSDEGDETKTNDAEVQTSFSNECSPEPQINPIIRVDDDRDILDQLFSGKVSHRELEKYCDSSRAVVVRRKYLRQFANLNLDGLPFKDYDYKDVNGACCENLIGYIPMPTGIVGPLNIDGEVMYMPLATTEGALIASTNRGCKALVNGVTTIVSNDGMTRAPCLSFDNIIDAGSFKQWIERPEVFEKIKSTFEGTSRFCKLIEIKPDVKGDYVYLRFKASTGDAMGMNMVSKACSAAIEYIKKCKEFEGKFKVISLSGNMCVDKKASALNWIEGRGKSVTSQAIVPASIVGSVLKCTPQELVNLAQVKLNIGSSSAVCIGGSNAHAANIVASMFIATGQDAAQVVSSSMCLTEIKKTDDGDLKITCSMNCLEVGTVGGGTILGPQHSMLKMLGCAGSHNKRPGKNAERLAKIICATVLAGELSLLAAQCSNDLVRSHMKLNRSSIMLPLAQKSIENTSRNSLFPNGSEKLSTKKPPCIDRNSCMTSIL